jgi:hypothetical protein
MSSKIETGTGILSTGVSGKPIISTAPRGVQVRAVASSGKTRQDLVGNGR